MDIYISGPPIDSSPQQQLPDIYSRITTFFQTEGHRCRTSFAEGENYQQLARWLLHAQVVVLEVSDPASMLIGQQLALAVEKHKSVIALYQEGREPSFFMPQHDSRVVWLGYTPETLEEMLAEALEYVSLQQDVRFNLLLPANLNSYLDYICREKSVSKSHFIRELIREHMNQHGLFKDS